MTCEHSSCSTSLLTFGFVGLFQIPHSAQCKGKLNFEEWGNTGSQSCRHYQSHVIVAKYGRFFNSFNELRHPLLWRVSSKRLSPAFHSALVAHSMTVGFRPRRNLPLNSFRCEQVKFFFGGGALKILLALLLLDQGYQAICRVQVRSLKANWKKKKKSKLVCAELQYTAGVKALQFCIQ